MPLFLALYMMPPEAVARFRALPQAEQDATDAAGLPQWAAWEARHAGALVTRGGMVGRTMRATRQGVAPATNHVCGYLIVEAETAEAAAALFLDHPHIGVFPGESVDVMPFVTGPDL